MVFVFGYQVWISPLPFALNATTSALDVSYTSSNTDVATVDGNVITIVGIGQTRNYCNSKKVVLIMNLFIPSTFSRLFLVNCGVNVYGLNQVSNNTAATF